MVWLGGTLVLILLVAVIAVRFTVTDRDMDGY
jgi:hypothetical protein